MKKVMLFLFVTLNAHAVEVFNFKCKVKNPVYDTSHTLEFKIMNMNRPAKLDYLEGDYKNPEDLGNKVKVRPVKNRDGEISGLFYLGFDYKMFVGPSGLLIKANDGSDTATITMFLSRTSGFKKGEIHLELPYAEDNKDITLYPKCKVSISELQKKPENINPPTALEYQIKNIAGTWMNKSTVFLIKKYGNDRIKFYRCDKKVFFTEEGLCKYDRLIKGVYDYRANAFCIPWKGYRCNSALQVSVEDRNVLLEITDPLDEYNWANAGSMDELRRIR